MRPARVGEGGRSGGKAAFQSRRAGNTGLTLPPYRDEGLCSVRPALLKRGPARSLPRRAGLSSPSETQPAAGSQVASVEQKRGTEGRQNGDCEPVYDTGVGLPPSLQMVTPMQQVEIQGGHTGLRHSESIIDGKLATRERHEG